jgi:hypothetical protein
MGMFHSLFYTSKERVREGELVRGIVVLIEIVQGVIGACISVAFISA